MKGQISFQSLAIYSDDPDFRDFLKEIVDNRIGENQPRQRSESSSRKSKGNEVEQSPVLMSQKDRHIKSPSDITLYSPALKKASNKDEFVSAMDKISNFVESIRLSNERKQSHNGRLKSSRDGRGGDIRRIERLMDHNQQDNFKEDRASTSKGISHSRRDSERGSGKASPSVTADKLLLQAEKFKERIEAHKGKNFHELLMPYDYEKLRYRFVKPEGLAPLDNEIMILRNFDQDDEFFHITSQIEPTLRSKIERGEFIELERLLPKDRAGRNSSDDINRQLISQGTNSFLEPPPTNKVGKINSIRKWDQAFRVYAAIYTNANPNRSSDIWQYIYVIHTAAAVNQWDNVYYYDINFCELMASKPWRSWGKTCTQGWNMAFNNNAMTNSGNNANNGNNGNYSQNKSQGSYTRDWKDDCCWRYNKNRCKRTAAECNFDHRCTFCAGWNHGFHNCRKRNKEKRPNTTQERHTTPKKNNSPKGDRKKSNSLF